MRDLFLQIDACHAVMPRSGKHGNGSRIASRGWRVDEIRQRCRRGGRIGVAGCTPVVDGLYLGMDDRSVVASFLRQWFRYRFVDHVYILARR